MANPEHVALVKKGHEVIAAWRTQHPTDQLDLREANLIAAQLSRADLSGVDLRGARLYRADLIGAKLSEADLSGADLSGAELSEANLRGAALIGAGLFGTNLRLADLGGADFDKAIAGLTVFGNVDLSEAKSLETIVHKAPSIVGVDTLFKSKGNIPAVFLRGCGVPDALIEYLPSLIEQMQPIQFYSCFISYSGKDDAFARRLHSRLESEKLRVWFAPEDMRGGRKSEQQIDEAIRLYDRLLLVLSEHSMNSEWVRREIKKARKKEKERGTNVLFPIGLVPHKEIRQWECLDSDSGEDLAEKVREYHISDFSNWKQEDEFERAFATLMRDLRREGEPRPSS